MTEESKLFAEQQVQSLRSLKRSIDNYGIKDEPSYRTYVFPEHLVDDARKFFPNDKIVSQIPPEEES